jgi:nicotinate-nucleotide adenylyltransferase
VKIGLFGGTFDPVHNGHVSSALSIYHEFALDRILFIPSKIPVHKTNTSAASDDRCAMLDIALRAYPFFQLSRIEIDRSTPSFSVITIEEISRMYPTDELFFLIGTDAFNGLLGWREPDNIIEKVRFIVMSRGGEKADPSLVKKCCALQADNLRIDVSSHDIRERLLASETVDNLIDSEVLQYIREKGLYKGELV